MEVIKKGAVCICDDDNADCHTHFSCNEVNKKCVYGDTENAIANRFNNRTSMIFMTD